MVAKSSVVREADEASSLLVNDTAHSTPTDGKHLAITITAIALGSFLAAFDLTVVAAIYPTIGGSFNALNQASYIATAYLLANTALQPLYGRLSDIYGRKNCLLFANAVFLLGTIGCCLAPNLWVLVLSRGIAGLGGGGLNVVGVVILSDLVPVRERGIYQGIMNLVFGTGSALGAPLGGLLSDAFGWRLAFVIQVPVIFISLFMVKTFIKLEAPESTGSRCKRIDFYGSITLVLGVSFMICGLNIGGNLRSWKSPLPLALMAAAFVLIAAFVYIEAHHANEPIMPMRLMTARTPALTNFINFFSSAGYFILIFNLPLFYRAVINLSAADAGKRLIPAALGGSIGSLSFGLIMNKTGRYRIYMNLAAGILVVAPVLAYTLEADRAIWAQYLFFVPGGFGFGALLTTTLIALLSAIKPDEMASATGTSYLFRSTGSIVGISASNNVLNALLADRLTYLDSSVVQSIKQNINTIWNDTIITPKVRQRVLKTYVHCMHVRASHNS